jgi:hypothetical protein
MTSLEAFEHPPALPEGSVNQYTLTTANTITDGNTATHKNRSLRIKKNNRPDLKRNIPSTQSTRSSTNKRPHRDPSSFRDSSDSDSSISSIDPYSSRCHYCGREGHI